MDADGPHAQTPDGSESERRQRAHIFTRVAAIQHIDNTTYTQPRPLTLSEGMLRGNRHSADLRQRRDGLVRIAAVPAAGFDGIPGPDDKDLAWCGIGDDKLYLQDGFTSTLLDSSDHPASRSDRPAGIAYDGTDTLYITLGTGLDRKLYLLSGQFTSTLKDSEDIVLVDSDPSGISHSGTDTPWSGNAADKHYLQSGRFTSTIKDSLDVSATDPTPADISWDGTDTPWVGSNSVAGGGGNPERLYLNEGQFTSTVLASLNVTAIDLSAGGISWDGTDTPWSGSIGDKLYLQSGQFTSTVKNSVDVSSIDAAPTGIDSVVRYSVI